MEKRKTPFACHVFVCVNDRNGELKSCADSGGLTIKDLLKARLKALKLRGVRVSQSGCLGICETGPNVMIYPHKVLFTHVTVDDIDAIVSEVGRLVGDA